MEEKNKKTVVTGVQPSGVLHIGNYFGAVRQAINLQQDQELTFFVADYHAMTSVHDRETLSKYIQDIILDFMALGIDPRKCTFYRQSDVPAHLEMAWIFGTLPTTTVPYLERAHAYKDKISQGVPPTAGLFFYPVLMSADIAIHNADLVPVGKDQLQHLEIAREMIRAFNKTYETLFTEPKAYTLDQTELINGQDGTKMSKSKGNILKIFATEEEIKKYVLKIPTDSTPQNDPKPLDSGLFQLHSLFLNDTQQENIRDMYVSGASYKDLKDKASEDIILFTKPFREARQELEKDSELVHDMLAMGARTVNKKITPLMEQVRKVTGLQR
jgi:tryptophanyl-tRNA synthetase